MYLQVTLMGIGAFLGGMITLTPECLQPLIAPPRASTMKLTRNLMHQFYRLDKHTNIADWSISLIFIQNEPIC